MIYTISGVAKPRRVSRALTYSAFTRKVLTGKKERPFEVETIQGTHRHVATSENEENFITSAQF